MPEATAIDDYASQLLKAQMLSAFRQDDSVGRQAVMNHQLACHLMDLNFIRDATEMSIPESYAIQGLSLAHAPREAQSINLAHTTPKAS